MLFIIVVVGRFLFGCAISVVVVVVLICIVVVSLLVRFFGVLERFFENGAMLFFVLGDFWCSGA